MYTHRAEGELLALCAHRNIARLIGANIEQPSMYLVIEYCKGVMT
jgi:hypothetical protein